MTGKDLIFFRSWFSDFCTSFYSASEEDQRNILLKEEHTRHVCENMRLMAGELPLKDEEALLAETVALFHDVGRFPQYAKYRTFRDALSVNHAALGARILAERGVLGNLLPKEQALIRQTVRFHNVFSIPDMGDREALLLLRLIRDADKLDIWRVFVEYYESPVEERATAVGLGLPDGVGYSPEVMGFIFEKRVISLSNMKTLDDFKILQLSWIFDLHFGVSLKLLIERDYIRRIAGTLPQTEEVMRIPAFLEGYIHQRLQEGDR
jgi:hypothetical protein